MFRARDRKPTRVLVRLQGRLGNQLFQLAAARSIASDGASVRLIAPLAATADLRTLLPDVEVRGPWSLLPFGVLPHIESVRARRAVHHITWPLRRLWSRRIVVQGLAESYGARSDRPTRARRPIRGRVVVLQGYFQHPGWFEPGDAVVAAQLAASLSTSDSTPSDVLTINVRAEDYRALGHVLPMDYYLAAVRAAVARNVVRSVRVVGLVAPEADPEVAELLAWLRTQDLAVELVTGGSAVSDFETLCRSRRLIIANSTFAWWAARVGDELGGDGPREVFLPEPWLRDRRIVLGRSGWTAVPWTSPPTEATTRGG